MPLSFRLGAFYFAGGATLHPKYMYSPLTRDFRTWKRYQGGWAQDLYVYDLDKQAETQIVAGGGYEISADGKAWTALYTLARQDDGSWRITGCYLKAAEGQNI